MATKIVDYKLVAEYKSPEEFSSKIREKLKEGWTLHGETFVIQSSNGTLIKYQAVIKLEEVEDGV